MDHGNCDRCADRGRTGPPAAAIVGGVIDTLSAIGLPAWITPGNVQSYAPVGVREHHRFQPCPPV